ncbi:MAG: NADH-quinone oxidoreductase subunit C [Bacteroidales bacterium]|nr:NADH-quinone oxidoreductase subunit C [Bacteroidales bacterium]
MDTEAIIKELNGRFSTDITETVKRNDKRYDVTINPSSIVQITEFLYKEAGCRFIIASALHTKKGFEIHYHFSKDETGLVLNIHVILSQENPRIESLSNIFNASNWIEREIHELFGIDFINHPNMEKLLSDGNWPEGVYPYRKEFK